jgi:hypothetical protein
MHCQLEGSFTHVVNEHCRINNGLYLSGLNEKSLYLSRKKKIRDPALGSVS